MTRVLLAATTALGLTVAGGAQAAFTVTAASVSGDAVHLITPEAGDTTAGPIVLTTSVGTLVAWCIDLFHQITIGGGLNLSYSVGALSGADDSSPAHVQLTATQVQEIAGLAVYGEGLIGTANGTADNLAAVQLAIWTIEYPTFTYTGAAGAPVAAYIALAPSLKGSAGDLIALSGTQGLVTADLLPAAVPEPATLALFGASLLGLRLARRRA